MFCSKCGAENPEEAKFCSKCGAALGAAGKPSRPVLTMAHRLTTFILAVIAPVLIGIGFLEEDGKLTYAGIFVLPFALIWGGLFLEGERLHIRVTLLAIGGLLLLIFMATIIYPVLQQWWFW